MPGTNVPPLPGPLPGPYDAGEKLPPSGKKLTNAEMVILINKLREAGATARKSVGIK